MPTYQGFRITQLALHLRRSDLDGVELYVAGLKQFLKIGHIHIILYVVKH